MSSKKKIIAIYLIRKNFGQQQLLLIALGVIVVAVAVGMNQFSTSEAEANRDQLISDLNFLSVVAQAYYKKPASYGGVGNSYTGWEFFQTISRTM